eukprot:CAMPEP_0169485682 /NCGR_PEP_ID=MMETSP1042-20121227/32419_1 /TAXON_ID=464988 /ORGANISM="Hemiselmis andersenii, Strain CCMP1180" /LENGTH=161 /DNA_ID=CAMNT_0009600793 /DNA_START=124 /DNA_END=609 /DNA_ORIENTATION=+
MPQVPARRGREVLALPLFKVALPERHSGHDCCPHLGGNSLGRVVRLAVSNPACAHHDPDHSPHPPRLDSWILDKLSDICAPPIIHVHPPDGEWHALSHLLEERDHFGVAPGVKVLMHPWVAILKRCVQHNDGYETYPISVLRRRSGTASLRRSCEPRPPSA